MSKKISSGKLKEWWPLIAVAVVFVATFAIVWGIRAARLNNTKALTGDDLRAAAAMSSEDLSIDGAMFNFYMYNTYMSFLNYYGASVSTYYGLDPSVSLKLQEHPDGGTWYDFFAGIAKTETEKLIILVCEAEKAGISLTEADRASIQQTVDSFTDEQLINGITREDIKGALELQALAQKYQSHLRSSIEITDDEVNDWAESHPNQYTTWQYRTYSIYYITGENAESAGYTAEEAEALANELYASAGEEEYLAWIADHLQQTNGTEPEAALEEARTRSLVTGSALNEDNALSQWAYESGRKAGDMHILHHPDSSRWTVYLLVSPPALDDSPTVNVRHILVDNQAKAEELLTQWKSGEQTAQSFGQLAGENSIDGGSSTNGGLYENVAEGEMIAEFNNWCFDSSRQPGDSGLVQTSQGWHIMYFEDQGSPVWMANVRSDMLSEKYDQLYAALTEKYTITIDDDVIARIPG